MCFTGNILLLRQIQSYTFVVLKLAHGADPFLKNQEGQAPVDLSSADDVRCLLQDSMASQQTVPTATAPTSRPPSIALVQTPSPPMLPANTETVIMPSGASMTLSVPVASRPNMSLPVPEGCCSSVSKMEGTNHDVNNVSSFLARYLIFHHALTYFISFRTVNYFKASHKFIIHKMYEHHSPLYRHIEECLRDNTNRSASLDTTNNK